MNNENHQPLTIQGDVKEKDDLFGGSTNLSLDQLKKEEEGGTRNFLENDREIKPSNDNANQSTATDDYNHFKDSISETDVDDADGTPIDDWDNKGNDYFENQINLLRIQCHYS